MGQHIPDFHCPSDILPEVELDVPWYRVVIHDIPAQPLLKSYRGTELMEHLWDTVIKQTGLPAKDIWDLCILCWNDNLEKKQYLLFLQVFCRNLMESTGMDRNSGIPPESIWNPQELAFDLLLKI